MALDLIVNLLASFIWFILGWLAFKALQYFRIVQPAKRLWNIADQKI